MIRSFVQKKHNFTEGQAMESVRLGNSPFLQTPNRPPAFVFGGDGPYANTRAALAQIDLSPAKGKRVLLKPNAGRIAAPGAGITTDPQVVAAAIDAFSEIGADVAVGESPILGVKTLEAFDAVGITHIARERGCPLIDMDARKFVNVPVPDGLAIDSLKVCPEVFEYDLVVSLPVMKMHMHTGVTLSVKNMKGCLWQRSKVDLHMIPQVKDIDEKTINIAIADMAGTDASAGQAIPISKMCTVFAESEVVDRVADGANVSEIVRGVHEMVAGKAATLVRWLSKDVLFPVVFSGGVAKNPGVVRALKRSLGGVIVVPEHPQIIGALGAALIACDAP
jgi:hypothetical protein